MKNLKDIYVIELFFPEESTLTTEFGVVDLKLCKKEEEKYIDLKTGNEYFAYTEIGCTKVISAIPLTEYYYSIGIRKMNNYADKENVRKLVKQSKRDGIL